MAKQPRPQRSILPTRFVASDSVNGTAAIDHRSPQVERRLSRIDENYQLLDQLLCDLENRLPQEEKPNGNGSADLLAKKPR